MGGKNKQLNVCDLLRKGLEQYKYLLNVIFFVLLFNEFIYCWIHFLHPTPISPVPLTLPLATTVYSLHLWPLFLFFQIPHGRESTQYLSFLVWPVSLSTVPWDPSMLSQSTTFLPFLRPSMFHNNIPRFLCAFIHQRTLRLFLCLGYCK